MRTIAAHEEHRSTSRVLDILELLASADEQGYTLTEIAEQIGAPKSSIFPIIHTLHKRRFISANCNTGKYTIGIGAFAVGSAFLDSQTLYAHIKHIMTEVVNDCSEICQMGILDNDQVLYVAKVDSSESLRLISHVGKRLPLYGTALGKALILRHSLADLQKLYPHPSKLVRLTSHTITNVEVLFNQLQEFAITGITHECMESDDGIRCYAVPLEQDGKIVAAVSVSIPIFRSTEELTALVQEKLLEAKKNIEKLLADAGSDLEFFAFMDNK